MSISHTIIVPLHQNMEVQQYFYAAYSFPFTANGHNMQKCSLQNKLYGKLSFFCYTERIDDYEHV